jgi:nitrogenase subunit NifH
LDFVYEDAIELNEMRTVENIKAQSNQAKHYQAEAKKLVDNWEYFVSATKLHQEQSCSSFVQKYLKDV